MVKNYFLVTLRIFTRDRSYSFINVFGLTIGLASSLIILLWIAHEVSYDSMHQNGKHLFKVLINSTHDGVTTTSTRVPLPLFGSIYEADNNVMNACATGSIYTPLLTDGKIAITSQTLRVSSQFLQIFQFPGTDGKATTTLIPPYSAILTESTARSLFGGVDVIGQHVRLDNNFDLTVVDVLKDLPRNSSFQFGCLVTLESDEGWLKMRQDWRQTNFQLYVQLRNPSEVDQFTAHVNELFRKYDSNNPSKPAAFCHALNRWRMHSQFKNGQEEGGRISTVKLLLTLAGIIISLSCINFMNLTTAKCEGRLREVGVRKTLGSTRRQLILRFFGESFIITAVSFTMAIIASEALLPFYNRTMEKELSIPYSSMLFWSSGALEIFVISLAAGCYPAFFLSSFGPSAILKPQTKEAKALINVRQIFVIGQFVISVGMIICTYVTYSQIEFTKDRRAGYNRESLISVKSNPELSKNLEHVKVELMKSSVVKSATISGTPLTSMNQNDVLDRWPGKTAEDNLLFAVIRTDKDYVETVGADILLGRAFSDCTCDSSAMMLNESALKAMRLKDPIGSSVTFKGKQMEIIGVIRDMVMESPFEEVRPMLVIMHKQFSHLIVRMNQIDNESLATVAAIVKKYSLLFPFQYSVVDTDYNSKFDEVSELKNALQIFSIIAVAISCLGLVGLAIFLTERKRKEVAIRKVLGASNNNILTLFAQQFSRPILIALPMSYAGAYYFMASWLNTFDYRTSISFWPFVTAGISILIVAFAAVSFQLLRSSAANPADWLRRE